MTAVVPFSKRVEDIRSTLERMKPQLELALPKHLPVDRMLRVVMTSVQKTPKLLECTKLSLLSAVMQSAQLGLECDGVLGEAYLVPFKDQCQLIVGYRGLLKLCENSGKLAGVEVDVVYERDQFVYRKGLRPRLDHTPSEELERGEIRGAYAVIWVANWMHPRIVYMPKAEIDAIRARSRAKDSGPWVTDYAAMARKTVLRQAAKLVPASVEVQRAVRLDERVDAGLDQDLDVPAAVEIAAYQAEGKTRLEALAERHGKRPDDEVAEEEVPPEEREPGGDDE